MTMTLSAARRAAGLTAALALFAACSGAPPDPRDAAGNDAGATDATPSDAAPSDAGGRDVADSASTDTDPADTDPTDTDPADADPCTPDPCADEHRSCEPDGNVATCGDCLPGYVERDGLCEVAECDDASDCDVPTPSAWTECDYADACIELGERSRDVWQATCEAGTCVVVSERETEICERDTDGVVLERSEGTCEAPSEDEPCALEGIANVDEVVCRDGSAADEAGTASCARETDGMITDSLTTRIVSDGTPCDGLALERTYVWRCVAGAERGSNEDGAVVTYDPVNDFIEGETWQPHPELTRDYWERGPCAYETACSSDAMTGRWGYVCGPDGLEPGLSAPADEHTLLCQRDTEGVSGWHEFAGGCTASDYRVVACNDDGTMIAERRVCGGEELTSDTVTLDCGYCYLHECVDASTCRIVPPEGFVYVPPGTFTMGSAIPEIGDENEFPAHEVTITRGMFVADAELEERHYYPVAPAIDPWTFLDEFGSPYYTPAAPLDGLVARLQISPVDDLGDIGSWLDLFSAEAGFVGCYDRRGGSIALAPDYAHPADCPGYRLPTEAEWEYVARGGTTGLNYHVDLPPDVTCEEQEAAFEGQEVGTCRGRFGEIRTGTTNPFGLYDVLGNMQEACFDAYPFREYTTDAEVDPWGGPGLILRGRGHVPLRSSRRGEEYGPGSTTGYRLFRTAPPEAHPDWTPDE